MNAMSPEEAEQVSIHAGRVFQPRTPISARELFAGRWDQLTAVADAVAQIGLHVVVYGERGVGKTSLANVIRPVLRVFDGRSDADPAGGVQGEPAERVVVKVNSHHDDAFSTIWCRALDEISISEERPVLGFSRTVTEEHVVSVRQAWHLPDDLAIDHVRRILSNLPGSVFIFDEFDRADRRIASGFTDLIKALSDFQTPVTIILVGVAETVDGLVEGHASIGRALVQVHMPRMHRNELRDILSKAEEKLGVRFDPSAADRIVHVSLGLPHYTHLIGLTAVRRACKNRSRTVYPRDVTEALNDAGKQAEQSLITEFTRATRSAHREALYSHVLLACAITASINTDELGYFQPSGVVKPLAAILPNRRIDIATFNRHLAEFCDPKRGAVFQRTGQPRAFRYRFANPLLPPYVILKGISSNLLSVELWDGFLTQP